MRLALEVACFHRPGDTEQDRQVVALDAAALRGLLAADGPGAAPMGDGAFELGAGVACMLGLRLPERVLRWRGRVRLTFGFHLQDRPGAAGAGAAASAAAEPPLDLTGWFDSLLGATTPLPPGPMVLDAGTAVLSAHGWIVDRTGWRGPDSVALVFEAAEGGGRATRFDAELLPRPDIPRGFGRAIRDLAGCLCRFPLAELPLGRHAVAWEARFGGQVGRIAAPYAVTLDLDAQQRPRFLVEVTGSTRYA
jgi:hypothetical protein